MVETTYKPRHPRVSPLYQSILNHFEEFQELYEERFQKRYGERRDAHHQLY